MAPYLTDEGKFMCHATPQHELYSKHAIWSVLPRHALRLYFMYFTSVLEVQNTLNNLSSITTYNC